MADWTIQRTAADINIGDRLPPLAINVTLARLVAHAGSDRDFAPIHHNDQVARRAGADDAYVNNVFCQGMWERFIREYIGTAGRIRKVGPMPMRRFNRVGAQVVTEGRVVAKSDEGETTRIEVEVVSRCGGLTSVGPGTVVASVPNR